MNTEEEKTYEGYRICKKCFKLKLLETDFLTTNKNKSGKINFRNSCRECFNKTRENINKKYYLNRKNKK